MPEQSSCWSQIVMLRRLISAISPSLNAIRRSFPRCSTFRFAAVSITGVCLLLDVGYVELADIHEMACDCGRSSHHRADQMGARIAALAAFEIAIGGAGAAFVRR